MDKTSKIPNLRALRTIEPYRHSLNPEKMNKVPFAFQPSPYCRDIQLSVFRRHLPSRKWEVVADIERFNRINPSTLVGAESRGLDRSNGNYELGEAIRLKGEPVGGPIAGNNLQAIAWKNHCANARPILEDTADQDHSSSECLIQEALLLFPSRSGASDNSEIISE